MKKHLLLLGMTLLVSAASFAQWTKPVPSSFMDFKVTEPNDTTFFYLYNVGSQSFYAAGNQSGTQASIGIPALKCFVQKYVTDGDSWDGESYLIYNWSNGYNGTKWYNLFINDEDRLFVDHNAQANYFWGMKDNGDGSFRLYGSPLNPEFNQLTYTESSFMGYDLYEGSKEDGILAPMLDVLDVYEGHTYCVDWKLVSPEVYQAIEPAFYSYYAAKKIEPLLFRADEEYSSDINLEGIIRIYDDHSSSAAQLDSVRANLESALALAEFVYIDLLDYPEIDASEAKAALKTANFTKAELDPILASLQEQARLAEVYAVLDGATKDNPKDGTSLIRNASFDEGTQWQQPPYWTVEAMGKNNCWQNNATFNVVEGGTIELFMESWTDAPNRLKDGGMYQTLKQLPAGLYVLGADVQTTYQGNLNEVITGVELFAIGGTEDMSAPANTHSDVAHHFELTFISTGGDIQLGLRTRSTNANWILADNFTLMYFGPVAADPEQAKLNILIENLLKEIPLEDLDDLMANTDLKIAYQEEIEKAENATSDFVEQQASLQAAYDALKQSIADYVTFKALIDEYDVTKEEFIELGYDELPNLIEDELMLWRDAYDECTATQEFIAEAEETVTTVIINYITENLQPGSDITPLIRNANFDKDFSKWETDGVVPVHGGYEGYQEHNTLSDVVITSGNAEVFQNKFNMHQWIYNMPKGSFTLTCQAFERHPDTYLTDFEQGPYVGISTYLYANEYQSPVNNILAGAQKEALYHGNTDDYYFNDANTAYGYTPNGMCGASYYFNLSPETYVVKVNFSLTEVGDSILIGLKSDAADSWVIFDNFRLYYNGSDAAAYKEAFEELIAKLEDVVDDAAFIGKDAVNKVNAAIEAINSAVTEDDCAAALKNGNEALDYARESIVIYNALNNELDNLYTLLEEYAEQALPQVVEDMWELVNQMEQAITNGSATNEEAAALIEKAKGMNTRVKLPDYSDASGTNPVDMTSLIFNPDFDLDLGIDGWVVNNIVANDMNNGKGQGRNLLHLEDLEELGIGEGGILNSTVLKEMKNTAFSLEQTLEGMPAGYYTFSINAFERNGTIDDALNSFLEAGGLEGEGESAGVEAYIFCNDQKALLKNLWAGAQDDYVWMTDGNQDVTRDAYPGKYIPDTTTSANFFFNMVGENGAYYTAVTIYLPEDGPIKFGLRKDHTQNYFIVADRMRLVYYGQDDPIATGIKTISEKAETKVNGIFNLAGQRLAAPQKGLNIINGVKVLIK